MSQMQPDPQAMQAMLAQLGGGSPMETGEPEQGGDWLVEAINAVHEGMVEEGDPQIVSMLGAILNNLTSVQAKLQAPSGQANGPAG